MKATEKEEKKNKITGIAVTVGIHAVLLLLFFFIIAWQLPDPPPKGIEGVEINLGFVDAGSGEEQSNVEKLEEELPVEEPTPEDVADESKVDADKFAQSNLDDAQKIKTEKEQKEEKEKAEKKEKQKINPNNEYKSPSKSDGDKTDKGDQGKEHGNPDSRNFYNDGKGDKGIGPDATGNLSIPGWTFDYVPTDRDPSTESGHVIFKFTIDENGAVINSNIKVLESRNLSPTTIAHYKKKLLASRFKPKNSNVQPDKGETGTLRFDIKTK